MLFLKNDRRRSAVRYISLMLVIFVLCVTFFSCGWYSDAEGSDTESGEESIFEPGTENRTESPTEESTAEELTYAPIGSETEDEVTEPDTGTDTEQLTEKETESETESMTEIVTEPDVEKLYGVNLALERSFGLDMKYTDEMILTRGSVYIRTEPSSRGGESTKVVSVDSNTALHRIGYTETWSRILYNGNVCYVSSKYLVTYATQDDPTGIFYQGSGNNASKVIVIDAGHQTFAMNDLEPNGPSSSSMKPKVSSGTVGCVTGVWEYMLNLDVALKVRDLFLSKGYSVVMIRETNNVTISNAERAQIANRYNASAFIRIHANDLSDKSKRGALTMCQSPNNAYNGYLYDESHSLSRYVIDAFCEKTGLKNLGILKSDTMTGINWCTVPTTIVEMGFMSNPDEDRYMATEEFKQNAALGIFNGVERYFTANEIVG